MNILVIGYYGQGNLGDDLFIDAFKKLFPHLNFTFTDFIETKHLDNIDAVFFGGGSFLEETLKISSEALDIIKTKKIFYIGVGTETNINSTHIELMTLAKVVAIRSDNLSQIKRINQNTIKIPDLIYYLAPHNFIPKNKAVSNKILILPNINTVPQRDCPYWKHTSWDHFKSEFSQFLDELILSKYK